MRKYKARKSTQDFWEVELHVDGRFRCGVAIFWDVEGDAETNAKNFALHLNMKEATKEIAICPSV